MNLKYVSIGGVLLVGLAVGNLVFAHKGVTPPKITLDSAPREDVVLRAEELLESHLRGGDRRALENPALEEDLSATHGDVSEWSTLPRWGLGQVAPEFAVSAEQIRASNLLRSKDLNVADIEIPQNEWYALDALISQHHEALRSINDIRNSARYEEVQSLVSSGKILRFTDLDAEQLEHVNTHMEEYARTEEEKGADSNSAEDLQKYRYELIRQEHRKAGRNIFYTDVDGSEYVVGEVDLPTTHYLAELMDLMELNFLDDVCRWFNRRGTVSTSQMQDLIKSCSDINYGKT